MFLSVLIFELILSSSTLSSFVLYSSSTLSLSPLLKLFLSHSSCLSSFSIPSFTCYHFLLFSYSSYSSLPPTPPYSPSPLLHLLPLVHVLFSFQLFFISYSICFSLPSTSSPSSSPSFRPLPTKSPSSYSSSPFPLPHLLLFCLSHSISILLPFLSFSSSFSIYSISPVFSFSCFSFPPYLHFPSSLYIILLLSFSLLPSSVLAPITVCLGTLSRKSKFTACSRI
jgi:hypothetical protein